MPSTPKTVVVKPSIPVPVKTAPNTPQERVETPRDINYPAVHGFTAYEPGVSKQG